MIGMVSQRSTSTSRDNESSFSPPSPTLSESSSSGHRDHSSPLTRSIMSRYLSYITSLYDNQWYTNDKHHNDEFGDERQFELPSSPQSSSSSSSSSSHPTCIQWYESALFTSMSMILNLLLLIVIIYTLTQQRCGDAWIYRPSLRSIPIHDHRWPAATIEIPPINTMGTKYQPSLVGHGPPSERLLNDGRAKDDATNNRDERSNKDGSVPLAMTTPTTTPIRTTTTADSPSSPSAPIITAASPSADSSIDEFQSNFDVASTHAYTWSYCIDDLILATADPSSITDSTIAVAQPSPSPLSPPIQFCPNLQTNEQGYQLSWFGAHVAIGTLSPARAEPPRVDCVQLPPDGYRWPMKEPQLPCTNEQGAIHWPNMRVQNHTELIEFNKGTPKNLYHFDAVAYDIDGLDEMSLAARYIPFLSSVRTMFDIGAGGGSLGILLRRAYGVTTIASAFADWPYCEYMTERGELCLLIDVMEALPFAKATFDMVHISWVYHGQQPYELWNFVNEIDRIIRPGGYIFMRGGWSNSQILSQRSMLSDLGYTLLFESLSHKPIVITSKVSFGPDLPYHADWTAIYVKPSRVTHASKYQCKERREMSKKKAKIPIPIRTAPTQMGNVMEE